MAIDRLSSGHMQQGQEFANRVDARSFQQQQHSKDQMLGAVREAGQIPERAMQAAEMRQRMQGNALRMAAEKMRQQEYYQRLQAYSAEAGLRGQLAGVKAQELQNSAMEWNLQKQQKEWEKSQKDPYSGSGLKFGVVMPKFGGGYVRRVPVIGGGSRLDELSPEEAAAYKKKIKDQEAADLEEKRSAAELRRKRAAYYGSGGRVGGVGGARGKVLSVSSLGKIIPLDEKRQGIVFFNRDTNAYDVREATAAEVKAAKKGPSVTELKAALEVMKERLLDLENESGPEGDSLREDIRAIEDKLLRQALPKRGANGKKRKGSIFGRPAKSNASLAEKLRKAGKPEAEIKRYLEARGK